MELRLKTKADHDFLIKVIRKHNDFYKELNVTNSKFDETVYKDELDWLKALIDSSFTLIWENGKEKGFIGTLYAFTKNDVVNDGEEDTIKKVYWYSLPANDSVELTYKTFLENYFKCQIEGVQINGSISTKKPVHSGKSKPSGTNRKSANVLRTTSDIFDFDGENKTNGTATTTAA